MSIQCTFDPAIRQASVVLHVSFASPGRPDLEPLRISAVPSRPPSAFELPSIVRNSTRPCAACSRREALPRSLVAEHTNPMCPLPEVGPTRPNESEAFQRNRSPRCGSPFALASVLSLPCAAAHFAHSHRLHRLRVVVAGPNGEPMTTPELSNPDDLDARAAAARERIAELKQRRKSIDAEIELWTTEANNLEAHARSLRAQQRAATAATRP